MEQVQEVWDWLDKEYGGCVELASALVQKLTEFTFKITSKTDSAKFLDLYTTWIEVYNYLKSVGQERELNHGPTIDEVAKKLPDGTRREWVTV